MPWQQQVADVGGEIDSDTGLPAYREVIVTVPRQSGKTTLVLSWEIQRAIGWQHLGPQRIAYTAQTGNDARKKLIEDQVPLLLPHRRRLGIKRVLKGMGNEAVEFNNGSRIVLLASGHDAGHGKTLDLGVKDELFADADERRDQAMVPAMATRRSAQMLTPSTMGTDDSVALNRAVERGRAAVEAGSRSGIAYFEWSAPEGCDPDDPAVWWRCMPALGITITEHVVRHARQSLSLPEFRRAFLNIRDSSRGDSVIPPEAWAACLDTGSQPTGPVSFSIDVSEDRSWSSIAVASESGRGGVHVEITGDELFDYRPGTEWVVARASELQGKWGGKVAVAVGSPAWSLEEDLKAAKVIIELVQPQEHAQACGDLFDAIKGHRLRHIGQAPLDAAVVGADKRPFSGDAWLWSRRASAVDISPLVAVTLAHWVAQKRQRKPGIL